MIKVLVVDDNVNNRMTIELLLEEVECEMLEAIDGVEAVKILKEREIDLVLMDIMMPNMDGIEATRQIREFNKKVMIIAVTALDDDKSKDLMLKYGAEDYILKPIDPKVFIKRIENYIDLIKYRNCNKSYESEAINLFDKNIYNRCTIFKIRDKNSLSQFWEYFLTDSNKNVPNLNNIIKIIYAFGLWKINNGKSFDVIYEESDEFLYLTEMNINFINILVVKNIILRHEKDAIFKIENNKLSFKLKKESLHTNFTKLEEEVLRTSHVEKVTAKEYVEGTPFNVLDKIDSLQFVADEIDDHIYEFENHKSRVSLNKIVDSILKYDEIIDSLLEFQHLSFAINSLANFLKNLYINMLDDLKFKKLIILLINIFKDLENWRSSIFIVQDAKDIHYIDSSLLSSCLQIENIVGNRDIEESEDDIEFF